MATKKKRLPVARQKSEPVKNASLRKGHRQKFDLRPHGGAQQGAKALVRSEHLRARAFDGKSAKWKTRDTS
jgi:hypothetical protein